MKVMIRTLLIWSLLVTSQSFSQTPTLTLSSGHTSIIRSVLFSPDERYILSCSDDNTLKIWDIKTGNEIRTFKGHTGSYVLGSFLSGNRIVSGGRDKTLRIWNPLTGEQVNSINTDQLISCLKVSHDGKYVATSHFIYPITLRDATSGAVIRDFEKFDDKGQSIDTRTICFSVDDKYLVSGSDDNIVRLWDVEQGKLLKEFNGHTGKVTSVCITPDGKKIVSGSEDNTVKIWDLSSGNVINTLTGHTGFVNCTAVSNNGRYILSGGQDGKIISWDIESGKENKTYSASSNGVYTLSFSDDDKTFLCGVGQSIQLWDFNFGKLRKTFATGSYQITSLALSPDRNYLYLGKKDKTTIWDAVNWRIVNEINLSPYGSGCLAFSANKQWLGSIDMDKTIKLADLQTNKISILPDIKEKELNCADISPDASQVIVGGNINDIMLIDAKADKKPKLLKGHNNRVTSVKFLPDGQQLLSASWDLTLILWDAKSGKKLKTFEGQMCSIDCMDISPDGKLAVSGGNPDFIRIWDLDKGKEYKKLGDHKGAIHYLKFSPDGKWIVSNSFDGHDIVIWDLATGKQFKTLKGHTNYIYSLAFLSGDEKLISYSYDNTVRIWDIKNAAELAKIYFLKDDNWVASTPDGLFDGTKDGMKNLYYVKGMETIPLENLFEQYYTPKLLSRIANNEFFASKNIDIDVIGTIPTVKITTPENNTSVSKEQMAVSVKVIDMGGGVDEVRLYHNGKLLDGTTRGFKQVGQEHKFTVTLTDGENQIKATAFNTQRTESIPDEIVVNYKAPQQIKPNMHILAIGINSYLNPKYSLNFAKNDAEAFVQSLQSGAASIFGKVNIITLSDANATRAGIMAAIDKIKTTAKAEDVFVFYYAGHGVMSSGNETEKPLFYLVPYDVTKMYEADDMLKRLGISATEIGEFSKNIKAQKQLFVIDACQSGGAMQTLAMRGAAEEKAIAQLARSTGTYFIAASGTEQFATEVAELGHGIFTYSVIEALKGSCKAQDGKVTVNLLKSCVEDLVPELSKKHKGQPQFPTGYGFGMDFPIVIVK